MTLCAQRKRETERRREEEAERQTEAEKGIGTDKESENAKSLRENDLIRLEWIPCVYILLKTHHNFKE